MAKDSEVLDTFNNAGDVHFMIDVDQDRTWLHIDKVIWDEDEGDHQAETLTIGFDDSEQARKTAKFLSELITL